MGAMMRLRRQTHRSFEDVVSECVMGAMKAECHILQKREGKEYK
jgi:hypothetical protein